jgi:hypothetical protein
MDFSKSILKGAAMYQVNIVVKWWSVVVRPQAELFKSVTLRPSLIQMTRAAG